MKKIKILLVLLITFVVSGCSCSNSECKCPSENGSSQEEYKTVINDYSKLYEQTVQSVVMIRVQRKNNKNTVIATGSGVVAFEQGEFAYVLTNAHVVKGLTSDYEIEVVFSNSEGFPSGNSEIATLMGKDAKEDVAILEIGKTSKYKLATIGDSSIINKGDFVYTIGSPLARFNYTTSGNISSYNVEVGLDSSNIGITTDVYAILFDAPINQGNSGGALFNSSGELIGITTFKYDKIDSVEVSGMYGALPINFFMKVAKYLLVNTNDYIRPSLSIDVVSVNELGTKREDYGISGYVNEGVYVSYSSESTIARELIITEVNGVSISSSADFYVELLKYNVGDTINLSVMSKAGMNDRTVSVVLHA